MKKNIEWYEEIMKKEKNIKNDSQLAKKLDLSRQAISKQRKENTDMSVKTAVKVAKILEIDPMITISSTMYQQSKTEDDKIFWVEIFNEKNTTQNEN